MIPTLRRENVGSTGSPHRLRIAHLSDLHLWFSARKLEAIEEILAPWQPDVLALTGDYADTPRGQRLAAEWIARMADCHPVCWVAGNHDRWWGPTFLKTITAAPNAHSVDRGDAWITSASGCRYRFTSAERIAGRATEICRREPTVLLLHDPADIEPETLRFGGIDVVLAGHLHGGQITLWRDRRGRPQPATLFYPGLVERASIGAATLIVSRGLGDTLPVRFRAPQEIVMVDFWA